MSRDPHRALVEALTDYLGPLEIVIARTRDWASATFVGMQHELSFRCDASDTLIDALPDIDLPMDRQFVADLRLVSVQNVANMANVALEVLTICE